MRAFVLLPLAVGQLASAKSAYRSYTATYGDLNADGTASFPNLPGPYDGLYHGISGPSYNYIGSDCYGVCPQSFPYSAFFYTGDAPRSAYLSTAYPGSRVVSFRLQEFYFGCLARYRETPNDSPIPFPPADYSPANCTLTVQGFRKAVPRRGAKPDATATFTYTPKINRNNSLSIPAANMTRVKLPASFSDVQFVTFNATDKQPPYLSLPQVQLDNVSYITKNVTKT